MAKDAKDQSEQAEQNGDVRVEKHEETHVVHHEESFWRKYVFSTDHKMIGIQYGITALLFLLFGFSLMMLMRWQLAFPGEALPLIGTLFGEDNMPGGVMDPQFYNQLGAMHGTIMVFMGIVPLAVGAFGNLIVPLQIGAPDMAFPKINMVSYQAFLLGGIVMLISFFIPGGAAKSGWTSYPPLADIETTGQTFWLIGMIFFDHVLPVGRNQFYYYHHSITRKRPYVYALSIFCLDPVCHRFPTPFGIPSTGSGQCDATDGSSGRYQFFSPQRSGYKW